MKKAATVHPRYENSILLRAKGPNRGDDDVVTQVSAFAVPKIRWQLAVRASWRKRMRVEHTIALCERSPVLKTGRITGSFALP